MPAWAIYVLVIGVIANLVILFKEFDNLPNGAQGVPFIVFPLALIPYLFVVLKIFSMLGGG